VDSGGHAFESSNQRILLGIFIVLLEGGPTCQGGGWVPRGKGGVGTGGSHVLGGVGSPTRKWTGFGIMGPTCQRGGFILIRTHMLY
jgi:hypothetical protein